MKTLATIIALALLPLIAAAQADLKPVSVQTTADGVMVGADILSARDAIAGNSSGVPPGFHPGIWLRTNFQPRKFWDRNWKGICFTAGTSLATWGLYEIVDHNSGGSKSTRRSEDTVPSETETGDEEPPSPTASISSDVSGDSNYVVIQQYFNQPPPAAAVP